MALFTMMVRIIGQRFGRVKLSGKIIEKLG
jgi:hypothetical protein